MIGNREVTSGQRQDYWLAYSKDPVALPEDVRTVIDRIAALNANTSAGFRRQNLPPLLARYFADMRQVLGTFRSLLRPGAPAFVVVGNNHTIAGNQRVNIETDKLLAQLGESVGLVPKGTISMEMLLSRDVFRRNAGSAETIVEFQNG